RSPVSFKDPGIDRFHLRQVGLHEIAQGGGDVPAQGFPVTCDHWPYEPGEVSILIIDRFRPGIEKKSSASGEDLLSEDSSAGPIYEWQCVQDHRSFMRSAL